jgi:hypothetical protein
MYVWMACISATHWQATFPGHPFTSGEENLCLSVYLPAELAGWLVGWLAG